MRRSLEAPSTAVGGVPWPQRYAQLLDAHTRLQQTLAAREAAHRRARTAVKYDPALPNNDKFTRELLEQNHELTQRCRALELRLARMDGTRTATASPSPQRSVERKANARRVRHASVQTERVVDNNKDDADEKDNDGDPHATLVGDSTPGPTDGGVTKSTSPPKVPEQVQVLVAALKQRLDELDVDVARLQQENAMLRTEATPPTDDSECNAGDEQPRCTRAQQQELQHLLNDRVRQMKILEEHLTHLQHKVKTKTLLYKESLERVEQLTSELFDAKQTLLRQAEWLHEHHDVTAQLQLLEKEVHVLRSENATLNETVAVLSARPLDALNVQLEKKAVQISVLKETNARLEGELELARQDHRVVMQTNDKLRVRVETLTKDLETPLAEIQTLKADNERLVGEREIAQLQLQFYLTGDSTESKEFMEAVGRALKLIRAEQGGKQVQGETRLATKEQIGTITESAFERERADKMAEITKLIQEETRAQLQDLKIAHEAEVRRLKREKAHWKQRADEYLQEINALGVRGARAFKPHALLNQTAEKDPAVMLNDSQRVASPVKDPIASKENLLEVRVCDLRFNGDVHDPERSSFAVFCDYFDFESQHSPVFTLDPTTIAPTELEVSYKLLVDRAFCRSPLAQSLTVELHRLSLATATVVGSATVSLQSLFLSDRGYVAMSVKLLDPTTHVSVGTFRLAARLARPTNHLYRAWYHHNVTRVRPLPPFSLMCTGTSKTTILYLEIRVIAVVVAKDAAGEGTQGPTKVLYRFMGNAPVRYASRGQPIASYGFNVAMMDRVKAYEIPGDDHLASFLERYEMAVETESPSGMRGETIVPFRSIVSGFRARGFDDLIASTILSAHDASTAGGQSDPVAPIGRVWFELQALDVNVMKAPIVEIVRGPLERVLRGGDQGTLLDWRLFCELMSLTAPERAVRQLLLEKLHLANATRESKTRELVNRIKNVSLEDADPLATILRDVGIQVSRSELSFTGITLFARAWDIIEEDEAQLRRRQYVEGFRRFRLLAETIDSEWLRIEPLLRIHVESHGVLSEDPNSDTEGITWDSFAHRVRLIAEN